MDKKLIDLEGLRVFREQSKKELDTNLGEIKKVTDHLEYYPNSFAYGLKEGVGKTQAVSFLRSKLGIGIKDATAIIDAFPTPYDLSGRTDIQEFKAYFLVIAESIIASKDFVTPNLAEKTELADKQDKPLIVLYGQTPYSAIKEAIDNGRGAKLVNSGFEFPYQGIDANGTIYFLQAGNLTQQMFVTKENSWAWSSTEHATKSELTELEFKIGGEGSDTFRQSADGFATTSYNATRIVYDTNAVIEKTCLLKNVSIFSANNQTIASPICYIYNANNELVTSFVIGNTKTSVGEDIVDVTDKNIILQPGYKVAFRYVRYNASAGITRFYDFNSGSIVSGYVYAYSFEVSMESGLVKRISNLENSQESLEERVDKLEGNTVVKFSNPKVDVVARPKLRVLDIGNSYSTNPTLYLNNIVSNAVNHGRIESVNDFCYYIAYRSSGSFKTWVDCYNDQDNHTYSFLRRCGGFTQNTAEGSGAANDGDMFRRVLSEQKWDIIIIHQASPYATNASVWEGNSAGGYLKELVSLIKRHQPQAEIAFSLVHSYASDYSGNTEHSTIGRWENICKAVKWIASAYNIDLIIPYGTAIEKLRKKYVVTGELTMDKTHPAKGLSDYAASLVFFDLFVGRRYGVSLMDDEFVYDGTSDRAAAQIPESIIDVNDTTRNDAKQAAMESLVDYYEL